MKGDEASDFLFRRVEIGPGEVVGADCDPGGVGLGSIPSEELILECAVLCRLQESELDAATRDR